MTFNNTKTQKHLYKINKSNLKKKTLIKKNIKG